MRDDVGGRRASEGRVDDEQLCESVGVDKVEIALGAFLQLVRRTDDLSVIGVKVKIDRLKVRVYDSLRDPI
jgi:hypothetical protein